MSSNITLINHPVLQHKLTSLRSKDTDSKHFRAGLKQMSSLMAFELTRDLKTKNVKIDTPMKTCDSPVIDEDLILVTIMRAGNIMLEGIMEVIDFASVGHIGIYRDKFINNTVEYYFRLPEDHKGKRVLLLDPLLATGDTAVSAISRLKDYEVGPISFVCLLASKEGLDNINESHPDVKVYGLSVEESLNEKGYLIPGIGDAGGRIYGTH